jgi:hypothetical protein
MKRGGKRRKSKARPTQKQVVNVKVNVGDTVLLRKGNAPKSHSLQPFGQFRLMEGVGARYANQPVVTQQQSYGIAPASTAPMYNNPIKVGGGATYNANRKDDIQEVVNPYGEKPIKAPSKRVVPSTNANQNAFLINEPITSSMPMTSDEPSRHLVPDSTQSVRGVPSQPSAGFSAMNAPSAVASVLESLEDEEQEDDEDVGAMSVAEASAPKLIQSKLPFSAPGGAPAEPAVKRRGPRIPTARQTAVVNMKLLLKKQFPTTAELEQAYSSSNYQEVAEDMVTEAENRKIGFKARGGEVSRSGIF